MDEKDKEIAELKKQLEAANTATTTVTKERDVAVKESEGLKKTVAEKDTVIDQKNKDLVAQRQGYKKLADRSKEELEAMTESEKEALRISEENGTRLAEIEAENKAFREKAIGDKKAAIISKYAGKSPELKKLIEENFTKVVGFDKADTDEALEGIVKLANNMIGTVERNTINEAIAATERSEAGGENGDGKANFADTPEGKAMFDKIAPLPPPAAIAKPVQADASRK